MSNPFKKATPVATKLKILLFGLPGSGKTVAALSFPRVAYVSAEGGADLYGGRGFEFDTVDCKTLDDLDNVVRFIQQDNGKTYDTLVIDPITVFYDVLKAAYEKKAPNGELGFQQWGQINNKMKGLYSRLTDLPVHVVIIARESTEYETKNGNLTKVGVKPDGDRTLGYMFDFVVRMNADHSGTVIKSRGSQLSNLKQVNWSAFQPVAEHVKEGKRVSHPSEEEAAVKQAESLKWSDDDITEFVRKYRADGIEDSEVKTALKVSGLREWSGSLQQAHATLDAWVKDQLTLKAQA